MVVSASIVTQESVDKPTTPRPAVGYLVIRLSSAFHQLLAGLWDGRKGKFRGFIEDLRLLVSW
jgi:hypothetical protein